MIKAILPLGVVDLQVVIHSYLPTVNIMGLPFSMLPKRFISQLLFITPFFNANN